MDESQTPVVTEAIDRNAWKFGFTPQAEIWNGRFAMLGFTVALVVEVLSRHGFLGF